MKMLFQNQFNSHLFPRKYEVNTQPSCTVPDQTMSVKTIMERYAKGLPLGGSKQEIWDGEDDYLPDPKSLDLAELQEMQEANAQQIMEKRNTLDTQKRNKAKKDGDSSLTSKIKDAIADALKNPDSKAKLPAEGEKALIN